MQRLSGAVFLTLFVSPTFAQTGLGPDFSVTRHSWLEELPSGAVVTATNPYGNISARTADLDTFEVSAIIQKLDRNETPVDVRVEVNGDRAAVEVTHPRQSNATSDEVLGADYNGRVDATLLVPHGVRLKARTTAGDISVKRFEGNLIARTTSGKIDVVAAGSVQARTVEGAINASFRAGDWTEPMTFVSASGAIAVDFPSGASLNIRVRTGGKIETRFPAGTVRELSRTPHELSASFGAGEYRLEIESTSGNVMMTARSADGTLGVASPTIHSGDLSELPKVEDWQRGDPIKEIPKGTD